MFYIKGSDVCIDGLRFESYDYLPRNSIDANNRSGYSSLSTVIMADGDNLMLNNISISNAEFGFFLSGNSISLQNIYVSASQPLYAVDCNNLSLTNFDSSISSLQSSLFDHHIYLKGNCNSVKIENCYLQGGRTFAIQLSANYNETDVCPRCILICNSSIIDSAKCIVIDEGNTDVICDNLYCKGNGIDSLSCFASNRGGLLLVKNSIINNYTIIEQDKVKHHAKKRGESVYESCKFYFHRDNVYAFDLSCLDSLRVNKCEMNFSEHILNKGFIVQATGGHDAVGLISLHDNEFYMTQALDPYFIIKSKSTKVFITDNKFYNLGNDVTHPIPPETPNLTIHGNTYSGMINNQKDRSVTSDPDARRRGSLFVLWTKLTHRFTYPE